MADSLSVEGFSVTLPDFAGLLQTDDPVQTVETQLGERLEAPVRLLRWAIVHVTPGRHDYRVEGAYLRSAGPGRVMVD